MRYRVDIRAGNLSDFRTKSDRLSVSIRPGDLQYTPDQLFPASWILFREQEIKHIYNYFHLRLVPIAAKKEKAGSVEILLACKAFASVFTKLETVG